MLAEIMANLPLKTINHSYTYRVPEEFSFIDVGWRVFVPFGNRRVEGFVIGVREEDSSILDTQYKDIADVLDDEAWFSKEIIEASKRLSKFYLCSLAEIMRLFMPGKSGVKISVMYEALPLATGDILEKEPYKSVYNFAIEAGITDKRTLMKKSNLSAAEIDGVLKKMFNAGALKKVYDAKKLAKGLYETVVESNFPITEEFLEDFDKRKSAQLRLLSLLKDEPVLSANILKREKISTAVIKSLSEAGIIRSIKKRIYRDSYGKPSAKENDRELTEEQRKVLDEIISSIKSFNQKTFLLRGVTGSGKTEVYIRAAASARKLNRRVIVLVPEIGLTGQLVKSFKEEFADEIATIHSRLTVSERNDAIEKVRRGAASIVIGARSALFAPIDNVGLIILDEEHDLSYKQDESLRYHAKTVAKVLSDIYGATLILGSATPAVETYYKAKTGEIALLEMKNRVGNIPLPVVNCVDMRMELKTGNRHILSRPLEALIKETVARGEQVILLLNRRGFSTFVMCRSCGEPLVCNECSLPLVYHRNGRLACHTCDKIFEVPKICPKCGSKYIKYFGSGTEKLEEELKTSIPNARTIRMDRDTTTGKFAHQEILDKFKSGKYDILLGTQMVSKGHDVPNVTAVGIISADSSLYIPDFRASERAFTLITQTAGRAGRHALNETVKGKVIVQCYNTEHHAVVYGITQDYEGFYEKEIPFREALFYPPFCRLVKLIFHGKDEIKTKATAEDFAEKFNSKKTGKDIAVGPSPAMIATLRGVYRFVVLIKTANIKNTLDFLTEEKIHERADVAIDIDPIMMF